MHFSQISSGIIFIYIKNLNTLQPKQNPKKDSKEAKNDSEDGNLRTMAVHKDGQKSKSSFQRMKDFLGNKKEERETNKPKKKSNENNSKKVKKGKGSRVSALANRRRK